MRKARYTVAAAVLALGAAVSTQAQAAGELIQPGAYSVSGGSGCTLNFVYDGWGANFGKTYVGTAAHCVSKVGDEVALGSGESIGTVAFLGDQDSNARDYAFIEVHPSMTNRVSAGVKGHPSYPTGVSDPLETSNGDEVQISGHGLGYGLTTPTQERRTAVLTFDDEAEHGVIGPIHFGDSGGPLVHTSSGTALGIVSRLCVGTCSEMGPTVAGLIADAAANGFLVQLRTVR